MRAGSPSSPVSPSLMPENRSVSPCLLPEALQQSPEMQAMGRGNGVSIADVEMPDIRLPEAARRTVQTNPVPEAPPPLAAPGSSQPLLSNSAGIDADEEYSNDEKLLNDFIKLHPMLRYATLRCLHQVFQPDFEACCAFAVWRPQRPRPCSSYPA